MCVSASACYNSDPKGYAYIATRECSTQEPEENGNFDADKKAEHVYQCDTTHPYFDASGSKAKCLSLEECGISNYAYTSGDDKLCLTASECTAREDYYLDKDDGKCISSTECAGYLFGEGDEKQCLSKARCAKMTGYLIYESEDKNTW